MTRKRNVKKRRRRGGAAVILLAFAALFIYLCLSGFFNIETINVEGNKNVSESEIILSGGINAGDNIFSVSSGKINKRISSILLIKRVNVKKVLPNKLVIKVIERSPYLAVKYNGKFYEIDDEGVVIATTDKISAVSAVIVSGSDFSFENLTEKVDYSQNLNLRTCMLVVNFLKENSLASMISEIHISESGYYYLYTNNANVLKFYSYSAFESNKAFIKEFIEHESRKIMVEVVEGVDPVYKEIAIY